MKNQPKNRYKRPCWPSWNTTVTRAHTITLKHKPTTATSHTKGIAGDVLDIYPNQIHAKDRHTTQRLAMGTLMILDFWLVTPTSSFH
jgi:hypothetical protein